jgi:hypothetical protein
MVEWITLNAFMGNEQTKLIWRHKCSVFEYLDKDFIDTQAVIDATWTLALDFFIKTEENDGLVTEHAQRYINYILIPNKLILSDTNKIKNYQQIKLYLDAWYTNERSYSSVLKDILGVLERVERNTLPKVSNMRVTWFARSEIAASTNPISEATNSDVAEPLGSPISRTSQ